MSPFDNLLEMSLFFYVVQTRAINDMVHEDITLFQEIWDKQMKNKGKFHLWT